DVLARSHSAPRVTTGLTLTPSDRTREGGPLFDVFAARVRELARPEDGVAALLADHHAAREQARLAEARRHVGRREPDVVARREPERADDAALLQVLAQETQAAREREHVEVLGGRPQDLDQRVAEAVLVL